MLVTAGIWSLDAASAYGQRGERRDRRGESGAEFGWRSDYARARETARMTGKPMMVVIRCVP